MKETPENVLRRVQKLMAIANDSRADPNEAAAAAAQASTIMRKYQIEEADVIIASLRAGDDLIEESMQPRMADWREPQKQIPYWASILASDISDLTGARSVVSKIPGKYGVLEACIKFQGFSTDVKLAVYTMEFIVATMRRLRDEFKKGYTFKVRGISVLREYTKGVALGIHHVLVNEIAARRENDSAAESKTGDALVLAKASAIVERFGEVGPGRSMKFKTSSEEFARGFEDGMKITLTTPLNNSTDKPLELR